MARIQANPRTFARISRGVPGTRSADRNDAVVSRSRDLRSACERDRDFVGGTRAFPTTQLAPAAPAESLTALGFAMARFRYYEAPDSRGYDPKEPCRPLSQVTWPAGLPLIEPKWRTETVLGVTEGIRESRDFSRLLILADALQDAGCDNEFVLDHCRYCEVHHPHCWVVSAILKKPVIENGPFVQVENDTGFVSQPIEIEVHESPVEKYGLLAEELNLEMLVECSKYFLVMLAVLIVIYLIIFLLSWIRFMIFYS